MQLLQIEQKLLSLNQPVLQTRDVSAFLNVSIAHASKILHRLVEARKFIHLSRGKWVTSLQIDPLLLPEYITAPFPSYVSLQTALFFHGMISQIPHTLYAVSLARTKRHITHFGTISIHHINEDLFYGFEVKDNIKIAIPEKALIDLLYLTPAKSKMFNVLPEVDFPDSFDFKIANQIIQKISTQRLRSLVMKRFESLLQSS